MSAPTEIKKPIKKDRHSNAAHRGSPKKGGAGGKGTWGKGGLDDLIGSPVDNHDPNYDSEEEDEKVSLKRAVEVLNPFDSIIQDFVVSGEVTEAAKSLQELNTPEKYNVFVRKAIAYALEKQAFERELISQLLSHLYGQVVPGDKIEEGFQDLLDRVDDLVLDSPDAVDSLSKFLARAICDEIVTPKFPKEAKAGSELAKEVVALANAVSTERFRGERLQHVWGAGDLSSVKRLKEETHTLLEEYLTSGDLAEADKCVRALNAPSFNFHVVKQAVRLALQRSPEDQQRMSKLLKFLSSEGLVASDSMQKGFQACYETLGDIALDVPNAGESLKRMTDLAIADGYLPSSFVPATAAPTPDAGAEAMVV
eukprot:TRINITY_DN592_c0_g2_i1.p1 TRINITY_DN592_c0_g2~~TRINITY_DN592_c0_g2_i1.p1  ORF type:complete len:367 (-),score=170.11 TRINITY_DN592_c0_g2_i1:558-1658(-)